MTITMMTQRMLSQAWVIRLTEDERAGKKLYFLFSSLFFFDGDERWWGRRGSFSLFFSFLSFFIWSGWRWWWVLINKGRRGEKKYVRFGAYIHVSVVVHTLLEYPSLHIFFFSPLKKKKEIRTTLMTTWYVFQNEKKGRKKRRSEGEWIACWIHPSVRSAEKMRAYIHIHLIHSMKESFFLSLSPTMEKNIQGEKKIDKDWIEMCTSVFFLSSLFLSNWNGEKCCWRRRKKKKVFLRERQAILIIINEKRNERPKKIYTHIHIKRMVKEREKKGEKKRNPYYDELPSSKTILPIFSRRREDTKKEERWDEREKKKRRWWKTWDTWYVCMCVCFRWMDGWMVIFFSFFIHVVSSSSLFGIIREEKNIIL